MFTKRTKSSWICYSNKVHEVSCFHNDWKETKMQAGIYWVLNTNKDLNQTSNQLENGKLRNYSSTNYKSCSIKNEIWISFFSFFAISSTKRSQLNRGLRSNNFRWSINGQINTMSLLFLQLFLNPEICYSQAILYWN